MLVSFIDMAHLAEVHTLQLAAAVCSLVWGSGRLAMLPDSRFSVDGDPQIQLFSHQGASLNLQQTIYSTDSALSCLPAMQISPWPSVCSLADHRRSCACVCLAVFDMESGKMHSF